uniref:MFS domain-containing protein n=1 Tax=Macrostomum lignano TaxID=282301 RepID=A0A1I8JBK5_9PLAT
MRSVLRRHWAPLLFMWLAHAATGAANALPGGCLLVLASRVGASLRVMGLWFTVKSAAACLLAIVTGFAIPWLPKSRQRLGFLVAANLICAAALLALPMARSLWTSLTLSGVLGAGQSALETADGILVIVLFGSQHSRPVLQSLHLAVALGAVSAPALLHQFRNWQPPAAESPPFPVDIAATEDTANSTLDSLRPSLCQAPSSDPEAVFNSTVDSLTNNYTQSSTASSVSRSQPALHLPIFAPFAVVHAAQALAAVGFLALLACRHRLVPPATPQPPATIKTELHVAVVEVEVLLPASIASKPGSLPLWRRRLLVALTVAFYFCFVGVENVFWSFISAYGVCSRLRLTSLNAAFFAGFLAGRCLGVALARCVRPTTLLLADLAACQISLATLCLLAGDFSLDAGAPAWLTSASTAAFGLAVASIYAGGISWLEERLDVTGPLACSWTIGSQLGVSVLPALAGHLLISPSVGPAGVLYLALGGFTAATVCFAGMLTVAHAWL